MALPINIEELQNKQKIESNRIEFFASKAATPCWGRVEFALGVATRNRTR